VPIYLCKLPGGAPARFEAETPAAAAWAFVAELQPQRGRMGLIVWQDDPNSRTIAMSIDPQDDTPMGGRAAVRLAAVP
jgi:hypothetical protein